MTTNLEFLRTASAEEVKAFCDELVEIATKDTNARVAELEAENAVFHSAIEQGLRIKKIKMTKGNIFEVCCGMKAGSLGTGTTVVDAMKSAKSMIDAYKARGDDVSGWTDYINQNNARVDLEDRVAELEAENAKLREQNSDAELAVTQAYETCLSKLQSAEADAAALRSALEEAHTDMYASTDIANKTAKVLTDINAGKMLLDQIAQLKGLLSKTVDDLRGYYTRKTAGEIVPLEEIAARINKTVKELESEGDNGK